MKKLISKVTLIAFIYKSLLMPLAAMEASSPVQHHPQETSVVQILLPQDANHPIQLAKKQKQHTATASMFTPWKRAVEYYMVGQYKDMAGEMCMSAIIGFVVIGLTSLSLYFLYSYFTHLTPFGEALTGQVSHTPASGYHQLTTAAPQQHDVLKTAWNMMARNTNLTKTLFAAAGLYLQETDITNNVWDSIKTGTKPLQGAFQYLPKDVQSVFFQLCFSPRGHLASMGTYPLSNPELIAHQNFHDTCDPSQIDVRLAVQRPISRQLKRKGQSDAPHIAAFTHVSKTYEQLGLPSTQRYDSRRMLLGFEDNVYAQTVDHLFHSTTGLSQTVFANTMKLRADLCPGNNISLTLNEQMERLQSLMVHTDKDYTFFYLWFNTKGHLVKTGYEFSDDLEDFNKGDCDFNTGVDFDNDAHVRLAMDRNGHIVTTAQKHDFLDITPTVQVVTPTNSQSLLSPSLSRSQTPVQVQINATDVTNCLLKLKPFYDHDGFVNASSVVPGIGASTCADGSAMYPLNLDPTLQPYYLWDINGAATPYMDHRIGNMTDASLYYAISQLNATMMNATLPNGVSFDFASGVMDDLLNECSSRDAYPTGGMPLDTLDKWKDEFSNQTVVFPCESRISINCWGDLSWKILNQTCDVIVSLQWQHDMVNPEYWKGECGGPNCFNGAFMEKGFPSTKPRAGRLDGMIEVSGKIDKCYVGENAPLNTGNLQTPNTTFFSVDALLLNPQYATLDYIGRLFNIVSLSTLSTHELEAVTLYFKTLTVMYLNGTIKKCWAPQVLPAL